ncbi:uncharacterized protein LOC116944630 [Petromyzon marinus]|uniref:uncharacterized protein LOC116944630 n=1 Tax=Petromyzon marinus TaxID=7757 RepID=UPI003F71CB1D
MLQARPPSKASAMRHALSSARLQRCLHANVAESRKLAERLESVELLRARAAQSADRARRQLRRELSVVRLSTGRLAERRAFPGPETDAAREILRVVPRRPTRTPGGGGGCGCGGVALPAATETLPPGPSVSMSAGRAEVHKSTDGHKSVCGGAGDTGRGGGSGGGGLGGVTVMASRSPLATRRSGVRSACTGFGATTGDPRAMAGTPGASLSTAQRRRLLKALLPSSPSVMETRRARSADLAREARDRALAFLDSFENGPCGGLVRPNTAQP